MSVILPPWLCGLDIGQISDSTALCILERRLVSIGETQQQEYQCRHLERFALGTNYPDMVEQLANYLKRLPAPAAWQEDVTLLMDREQSVRRVTPPRYILIVDGTGVGRGIVDMFTRLALIPITVIITGGSQVTNPAPHEWHVPKPTLVGALQVVLQTRRFKVARNIPEAATLVKELQNFRYKITDAGNDTYGAWREGQHDDLVLAASLAAWYGEHTAPPLPRPFKPRPVPAGGANNHSRTGV